MDLSIITQGLEKLKNIGQLELSFKVSGLDITLKTLQASDDIYIAKRMEELKTEGIEYVQTYKQWIVAHSIVKINDFDLHEVRAIPVEGVSVTSKGADGKEITTKENKTVTKEQYLYDLVGSWSRSVLNVVFKKYGELLVKSELQAENGVQFETADVREEIERLSRKLKQLTEQVSRTTEKETGPADVLFAGEKQEVIKENNQPAST